MKNAEEVAERMYKLIKDAKGMKKYTAREIRKAAVEIYGKEVNKKICKDAIKHLIGSGQCIYTMYGGASYVEIPPEK